MHSSSEVLYLVAKTHRYLHNNPPLERSNPLLLSRWSRGSGSGLFEKTRSTTLAWLHVRYREIIASQFVRNGRAFRKRKCRRNQKACARMTISSEKMLNNRTLPFFGFFGSIELDSWTIEHRAIEFKANLNFSFCGQLFVCSFLRIRLDPSLWMIVVYSSKIRNCHYFLNFGRDSNERIIVRSALQSESKLTLTDVMACSLEAESIYERIAFVSPFKDFISQEEISDVYGARKIYLLGVIAFPPYHVDKILASSGTIWPFRSERVENFDGRSGNPVPSFWERLCSANILVRICKIRWYYDDWIVWNSYVSNLWKWILKN